VGIPLRNGGIFFEERRVRTLERGHCLVNGTLVDGCFSSRLVRFRMARWRKQAITLTTGSMRAMAILQQLGHQVRLTHRLS
jgi:hypothetical protein